MIRTLQLIAAATLMLISSPLRTDAARLEPKAPPAPRAEPVAPRISPIELDIEEYEAERARAFEDFGRRVGEQQMAAAGYSPRGFVPRPPDVVDIEPNIGAPITLAQIEAALAQAARDAHSTGAEPSSLRRPQSIGTFFVRNVMPGDVLNVRESPTALSAVVTTIPPNETRVEVARCGRSKKSGAWCIVTYGGQTGWVRAAYLLSTDASKPPPIELNFDTSASPAAASNTPLTDAIKLWFGKNVHCMNVDDPNSTRLCSGDETVSFVRIRNGYAEIELRGALANPTSGHWEFMSNSLFEIATTFRGIRGVRITENGGKAPHLNMSCDGQGPCVVFGVQADPEEYFDLTIDALRSE